MTTYTNSVDATRKAREGATLWDIADALLSEVGPGHSRKRFEAVAQECRESGIEPYGVSAMRQYRDVAAHWPKDQRRDGISFSAHRAALPSNDPGALLDRLAKAHGKRGVTVKRVVAEIEIENGFAGIAAKAGNGHTNGQGPTTGQTISDFPLSAILDYVARSYSANPRFVVATVGAWSESNGQIIAKDLAALAKAMLEHYAKANAKARAWNPTATGSNANTAPAATAPMAPIVGKARRGRMNNE